MKVHETIEHADQDEAVEASMRLYINDYTLMQKPQIRYREYHITFTNFTSSMKSVTDEWYCCSSLKRHLIFSIKLKNRIFANIHQPHNCGTQNISNTDFTGD